MNDQAPPPDIRILSGDPTAPEIAAVTAVLSAALDELAGQTLASSQNGPSAWQRSQRAIRTPLPFGAWRNVDR
ncbi:MAG: acyl-CoA carboxylase subunit epsilon [Pseudolysinimonas sp.]|uniref:acyl-CoA carboxylase subunit epsilon n=1 Tax=Pseudolysinimonas sp. TaxID=2680009 RepID=UPI003266643B